MEDSSVFSNNCSNKCQFVLHFCDLAYSSLNILLYIQVVAILACFLLDSLYCGLVKLKRCDYLINTRNVR